MNWASSYRIGEAVFTCDLNTRIANYRTIWFDQVVTAMKQPFLQAILTLTKENYRAIGFDQVVTDLEQPFLYAIFFFLKSRAALSKCYLNTHHRGCTSSKKWYILIVAFKEYDFKSSNIPIIEVNNDYDSKSILLQRLTCKPHSYSNCSGHLIAATTQQLFKCSILFPLKWKYNKITSLWFYTIPIPQINCPGFLTELRWLQLLV